MALDVASGTLSWLAADTVSTVKTITPGFEAKVVLLFMSGQGSATDVIARQDNSPSFGVALNKGTPEAYVVAAMSRAVSGTTPQGWGVIRNDAVAVQAEASNFTGTPGRLGTPAFTSTDVTFVVTAQANQNTRVSWLALGGSAITNYAVVTSALPAGTGNFDITGFGFTPTNADSLAIFFGSRNAGGTQPIAQNGYSQFVGIATSSFAAVINGGDQSTRTPNHSGLSGECINIDNGAGTDVGARASFSAWLSDGVRVNFSEASGTSSAFFALVIKGPQWSAGEITLPSGTGAFTAVSGLAFQPKALLTGSAGLAETTGGTLDTSADGEIGVGFAHATGTGTPTNRVAQAANVATSGRGRIGIEYDNVMMVCRDGDANTLVAAMDVSITSDGFTPNKTAGSLQPWLFWVAAGDAAAGGGSGRIPFIRQ